MRGRLDRFWPLARRFPFCAVCAVTSVVLLIAIPVLWLRLHALTRVHKERQVEGEAVLATLISAPQLRQELVFVQETVRRITENLASEDSLIANTNYFLDLAERCEAHAVAVPFNIPPPATGAEYKRIPFGLKVTGTFAQAAAFIHAVETGPQLANISYFSFRRQAGVVAVELNVDLLGKK